MPYSCRFAASPRQEPSRPWRGHTARRTSPGASVRVTTARVTFVQVTGTLAPMTTVVAVVESAASYRRGLEAALSDAGFTITSEPGDAVAVLLTLRRPEGCASADALVAAGKIVVALLPDADPAGHAHAFGHGVTSATPWDADPKDIVTCLSHAIEGWARLPTSTVTALAAEWPGAHTPRPDVTEEEVGWLADLAAGSTVARIADETGYSERAMFRRLREVYERLGVDTRAEALLVAERLGLFTAR